MHTEKTFNVVVAEDLIPNERVALTGNCDSLGKWNSENCVLLDKTGKFLNKFS